MAGKARMRYIARTSNLRLDKDVGHYRGQTDYGMECMYCDEYFPNAKRPEFGGHVCRSCSR